MDGTSNKINQRKLFYWCFKLAESLIREVTNEIEKIERPIERALLKIKLKDELRNSYMRKITGCDDIATM